MRVLDDRFVAEFLDHLLRPFHVIVVQMLFQFTVAVAEDDPHSFKLLGKVFVGATLAIRDA